MFQFQFMQGVIHFHVDYGRVQRLYGCGDVVIMRARSVIVQWIQNRHCLYAAVMFGMYSAAAVVAATFSLVAIIHSTQPAPGNSSRRYRLW